MSKTTQIPDAEIFGGKIADGVHDYAIAYENGKAAGAAIAVGKLFRGGFGYADLYAGSSRACRESAAWKGAMHGYMDGLPARRAIVVDDRGFIVSLDPEAEARRADWFEQFYACMADLGVSTYDEARVASMFERGHSPADAAGEEACEGDAS